MRSRIRRIHIVQDMLEQFKSPDIASKPITFAYVNEMGVDQQGVSRDVYTSFWEMFLMSAKGEEEKVPTVMPHMQRAEWQAVGHILLKGFVDHGIFPVGLSKVFCVSVLFGENAVTDNILMESLLRYVAESERAVIVKALEGNLDEEDHEDFMDLLSRFDCRTIPRGADVKPALLKLAHSEFVQQAKYISDVLASIVRDELTVHFPTVDDLLQMFALKTPTSRKVVKILLASATNADESRVLDFLKQFIRSLSKDVLLNWLHFVTGSRVMCYDSIVIHFNSKEGLMRAPIARTCVPSLEVSSSYATYPEFRQEFLNILAHHSGKFDVE